MQSEKTRHIELRGTVIKVKGGIKHTCKEELYLDL
jgi:hypothetical protein